MKKILITFATLLTLAAGTGVAQSKLDSNLQRIARKAKTEARAKSQNGEQAAQQLVSVFAIINDDAQVPTDALKEMGATIDFQGYGIVRLSVPATRLDDLESLDAFSGFEAPKTMQLMNKHSRTVDHVDEVQDTATALGEGLPQTYTGKGVVMGVFDSGIDFNHVSFRDDSLKTRIKEAMVFRDWYDIDNELGFIDKDGTQLKLEDIMELYTDSYHIDTLTTDCIGISHGTHTCGTAGGSYTGNCLDKDGKVNYTDLRSAAYEAELVLAGTPLLYSGFEQLALAEMDRYAGDKPLVVSLSLGNNADWMDGKGAMDVFYEEFTKNGDRPGRVICMAAGNEADANFTIYKDLDESDNYEIWTFLPYREKTKRENINAIITAYSDRGDSIRMEYAVFNAGDFKDVKDIRDLQSLPVPCAGYNREALLGNFYEDGISKPHDNRFYAQMRIIENEPLSANDLVLVHLYSPEKKPCKVRVFALDDTGRSGVDFKDYSIAGVTAGDNTSSFNTRACGNGLLSVGSWTASDSWLRYEDSSKETVYPPHYVNDTYPVGGITIFSSFTPYDDNGKAHPDFCAPGMGIKSGISVYDTTYFHKGEFFPSSKSYVVAGVAEEEHGRKDSLRSYIGNEQGTSMACPAAASIIALWLQAVPTLTQNQVLDAIKQTAVLEDNIGFPERFGAGKINALEGLKYILAHYGGTTEVRYIDQTQPAPAPICKRLVNGRIIIEKDGQCYDALGQRIR